MFTTLTTALCILSCIAPAQEQSQQNAKKSLTAVWKLDVEKTVKLLEEQQDENGVKNAKRMDGMTLTLKNDEKFEWLMPRQPGITGTWSIEETKQKTDGEKSELKSARVKLDPDNLPDHEDMFFDVEFVSEKVINATPPMMKTTIVFVRKEE